MVMITDQNGIERFSLSEEVNKLVERIKQKIVHEDSMILGIFFGSVGCGKSVKAMQIGYAIDKTLDNSRICFNKEEFIRAAKNNQKKVVIGDEGISLFFSRAAMTRENREITELMAQIRQKNNCILICVPNLLSIDSLILESANFVAYVWESTKEINGRKVTIKGNTAYFPELPGNNYKTRIIHYLKNKRSNPYHKKARPLSCFTEPGAPIGETFKTAWYPGGEKEYRRKKESILDKYDVITEEKPQKTVKEIALEEKSKIIYAIHANNPQINITHLSKMLNMARMTTRSHIKRGKSLKNG